jgi:hypothetical protein
MNIFVLDTDCKKAAQYHCDKHLVKMITEHNQILGSISHIFLGIKKKSEITPEYIKKHFSTFPRKDDNGDPFPYGIGYRSHPCTTWANESLHNYAWLIKVTEEMCKEYTSRYNKINAGEAIVKWYKSNGPWFSKIQQTPFTLAMPDNLKTEDAVHSYRLYYASHKAYFAKWKNGEPEWWGKYLKIVVDQKLINEKSLPNAKLYLDNVVM